MWQICESSVTLSGPKGFPAAVMRAPRATGEEKTREGEGGIRLELGGGAARGGAGCQGGPFGHEIKKKMQRDTRKINREEGLPGLV